MVFHGMGSRLSACRKNVIGAALRRMFRKVTVLAPPIDSNRPGSFPTGGIARSTHARSAAHVRQQSGHCRSVPVRSRQAPRPLRHLDDAARLATLRRNPARGGRRSGRCHRAKRDGSEDDPRVSQPPAPPTLPPGDPAPADDVHRVVGMQDRPGAARVINESPAVKTRPDVLSALG